MNLLICISICVRSVYADMKFSFRSRFDFFSIFIQRIIRNTLAYIDWNPDKEAYLSSLESLFCDYDIEDENIASYEHVMMAMKRWYMDLPKYSKNTKTIGGKKSTKKIVRSFRK